MDESDEFAADTTPVFWPLAVMAAAACLEGGGIGAIMGWLVGGLHPWLGVNLRIVLCAGAAAGAGLGAAWAALVWRTALRRVAGPGAVRLVRVWAWGWLWSFLLLGAPVLAALMLHVLTGARMLPGDLVGLAVFGLVSVSAVCGVWGLMAVGAASRLRVGRRRPMPDDASDAR